MRDNSRFFVFLKERIGLDVNSIGKAIVERAVRQRCNASGAADNDAYWRLLNGSPQEQQALIEAVIVPETWFFRYPESFATLSRLAANRLSELAGARPLRILSLPCSTGEEPYSIVMALLDAGLGARQFKVDAIDISPSSIERARCGLYGKNSFRSSDTGFRDRYFSPVPQGYQIAGQVRDCVSFQAGNLLDPELPARTAYDFVFCRNLVIYFDQPTQMHVFKVLKRLTREDGVLFVGPAEGSVLGSIDMRSTGIAQSFAFQHAPPRSAAPFPTAYRSARPVMDCAVQTPRRLAPRGFSAALRPLTARGDGEDAAAGLAVIARLANEGRTAEARVACERYLQTREPIAQVFYWLGLLSEVEGNAAQAQGFYRKALYLEPQHPESLAQLAALLAAQGDVVGARRLQDRAARGADNPGGRR